MTLSSRRLPDGRVIMEFSGKELIKGEPDASSFPSGGLRATFEARGLYRLGLYLAGFRQGRQPVSSRLPLPPIPVKLSTRRLPFLRSMDALNRQALRSTASPWQ